MISRFRNTASRVLSSAEKELTSIPLVYFMTLSAAATMSSQYSRQSRDTYRISLDGLAQLGPNCRFGDEIDADAPDFLKMKLQVHICVKCRRLLKSDDEIGITSRCRFIARGRAEEPERGNAQPR